jgi:hypothetical protein
MKPILTVILLHLAIALSQCQTDIQNDTLPDRPTYPWSYSKEIGLNMVNLATKFVPLNFNNSTIQHIAIKSRWYRRTKAVKIDFGANVASEEEFDIESQFFYLSFGIEKRRSIGQTKWSYTSSWEMTTEASPEVFSLGVSRGYGIEYNLSKYMYLSTNTSFLFGIGGEGPVIKLLPPTSLFVNVRF